MQTVITGQTTLENGKMVFNVCHVDGKTETREQLVYKKVSEALGRIRRDKKQPDFMEKEDLLRLVKKNTAEVSA